VLRKVKIKYFRAEKLAAVVSRESAQYGTRTRIVAQVWSGTRPGMEGGLELLGGSSLPWPGLLPGSRGGLTRVSSGPDPVSGAVAHPPLEPLGHHLLHHCGNRRHASAGHLPQESLRLPPCLGAGGRERVEDQSVQSSHLGRQGL